VKEPLVMLNIINGEQPKKPEAAESLGFTEGLWDIITECWSVDAGERPSVRTVLAHLNHATWSWKRKGLA